MREETEPAPPSCCPLAAHSLKLEASRGARTIVILQDIQQAQQRLRGVTVHTPLVEAPQLRAGPVDRRRLFLKLENLQPIGAFKLRGAYNDEKIIAGQGTMGLEILEDLPQVEVVLVPVGGGGMISGVAAAIKLSDPSIKVIGVEPALAADAQASFRSGKLVQLTAEEVTRTQADGLRTQSIGELNFEHVRAYVDDIITVSEEEIHAAMAQLAASPKTIAEPSGSVAVAGFLFHANELPKATIHAAVISGGNIEPTMLSELRSRNRP